MVDYLHKYIEKNVSDDLKRKMVFVGGPPQSGKTTMAKQICYETGFDTKTRFPSVQATQVSLENDIDLITKGRYQDMFSPLVSFGVCVMILLHGIWFKKDGLQMC